MALLETHGLAKTYGKREVVSDVSFSVDQGQIVGLLGPNGAGKSTSFRMTCGFVNPDRGRVVLDGKDVTSWPMQRRAKEGKLGYLPQQTSVFGKLTVKQNLTATMQLLGFSRKKIREESTRLLEEFQITKIQNSDPLQISGGERRRLEIARCLISNPKVIMLDEPFAGIDPVTVQSIQKIIRRLADSGIGILITDHAAREILQITSKTYVISAGKVLCSGTAAEVSAHPEVKEKYLGEIETHLPEIAGSSRLQPAVANTAAKPMQLSHPNLRSDFQPAHSNPQTDFQPAYYQNTILPHQNYSQDPNILPNHSSAPNQTTTNFDEAANTTPADSHSVNSPTQGFHLSSGSNPIPGTRPGPEAHSVENSSQEPANSASSNSSRQTPGPSSIPAGTRVAKPQFRSRYFDQPQRMRGSDS